MSLTQSNQNERIEVAPGVRKRLQPANMARHIKSGSPEKAGFGEMVELKQEQPDNVDATLLNVPPSRRRVSNFIRPASENNNLAIRNSEPASQHNKQDKSTSSQRKPKSKTTKEKLEKLPSTKPKERKPRKPYTRKAPVLERKPSSKPAAKEPTKRKIVSKKQAQTNDPSLSLDKKDKNETANELESLSDNESLGSLSSYEEKQTLPTAQKQTSPKGNVNENSVLKRHNKEFCFEDFLKGDNEFCGSENVLKEQHQTEEFSKNHKTDFLAGKPLSTEEEFQSSTLVKQSKHLKHVKSEDHLCKNGVVCFETKATANISANNDFSSSNSTPRKNHIPDSTAYKPSRVRKIRFSPQNQEPQSTESNTSVDHTLTKVSSCQRSHLQSENHEIESSNFGRSHATVHTEERFQNYHADTQVHQNFSAHNKHYRAITSKERNSSNKTDFQFTTKQNVRQSFQAHSTVEGKFQSSSMHATHSAQNMSKNQPPTPGSLPDIRFLDPFKIASIPHVSFTNSQGHNNQIENSKQRKRHPSIQTDQRVKKHVSNIRSEEPLSSRNNFSNATSSEPTKQRETKTSLHSKPREKQTSTHHRSNGAKNNNEGNFSEERPLNKSDYICQPKDTDSRTSKTHERRALHQNSTRFVNQTKASFLTENRLKCSTHSSQAQNQSSQRTDIQDLKPISPDFSTKDSTLSQRAQQPVSLANRQPKIVDADIIFKEPTKREMDFSSSPRQPLTQNNFPFQKPAELFPIKEQFNDSLISSTKSFNTEEYQTSHQNLKNLRFEKKTSIDDLSKELTELKDQHHSSSPHTDAQKLHFNSNSKSKNRAKDASISSIENHYQREAHFAGHPEKPLSHKNPFRQREHRHAELVKKPMEKNVELNKYPQEQNFCSHNYRDDDQKLGKISFKYQADNRSIEEAVAVQTTELIKNSDKHVIEKAAIDFCNENSPIPRSQDISAQNKQIDVSKSKSCRKRSSGEVKRHSKKNSSTEKRSHTEEETERYTSKSHKPLPHEVKHSSTVRDNSSTKQTNASSSKASPRTHAEKHSSTSLTNARKATSERSRIEKKKASGRIDRRYAKTANDSTTKELLLNEVNSSPSRKRAEDFKNIAKQPSEPLKFSAENQYEGKKAINFVNQVDKNSKGDTQTCSMGKPDLEDHKFYSSISSEVSGKAQKSTKPVGTSKCAKKVSQKSQYDDLKSQKKHHSVQSESSSRKHFAYSAPGVVLLNDNDAEKFTDFKSSTPTDRSSTDGSYADFTFKKPPTALNDDKQLDNLSTNKNHEKHSKNKRRLPSPTTSDSHHSSRSSSKEKDKQRKTAHKSKSSKEKPALITSEKHSSKDHSADISQRAALDTTQSGFPNSSEPSKPAKRKFSSELNSSLEQHTLDKSDGCGSKESPGKLAVKRSKHKKRRHSKSSNEVLIDHTSYCPQEESLIPDNEFHSLFDDMVTRSNCFFDCTEELTPEFYNELDMNIYNYDEEPLITDQEFHSLFDDMVARSEQFIKSNLVL